MVIVHQRRLTLFLLSVLGVLEEHRLRHGQNRDQREALDYISPLFLFPDIVGSHVSPSVENDNVVGGHGLLDLTPKLLCVVARIEPVLLVFRKVVLKKLALRIHYCLVSVVVVRRYQREDNLLSARVLCYGTPRFVQGAEVSPQQQQHLMRKLTR